MKTENKLMKEKVEYVEQLTEEKDQRIQELYELISSMGDKLTELIKVEIMNNREYNRNELQEIMNNRFVEFESQMIIQLNSRQDELKNFLKDKIVGNQQQQANIGAQNQNFMENYLNNQPQQFSNTALNSFGGDGYPTNNMGRLGKNSRKNIEVMENNNKFESVEQSESS